MKTRAVVRNVGRVGSLLFLIALGVGLSRTARAAEPCSTGSESRELDYWLGDWTITNPDASGGGHSESRVSLAVGRCLFVESWDNGKGHTGENLFAYSEGDKTWHGMFVDNEGRVHVFVDGTVAGGSAKFLGPSRGPKGEAVLDRIEIVRLAPNRVEQRWSKSTDKGNSWSPIFHLEYSRREP